MVRLSACDNASVAAAATALLTADNRRRLVPPVRSDLPAELHHRLVWAVAAALREEIAGDDGAADQAIVVAAQHCLASHDEGMRSEAAAMRLTTALDARPDELGELLIEALDDGRVTLFVAAISRAIGTDYDEALEIVLDPAGERLWLVLRANDLDREAIARIALALADADRRRDIAAFADRLDAIAAITPAAAQAALAPLRLPRDYRAARQALS